METLTNPSSPTSLQLRFLHRCRGSSSVLILIRTRAFDRRCRTISASAAPGKGGGQGRSWNGSDASPDSFAGWSGPESGGDSQNNGGYGGILGVGLAGVFFAAGVTFAAISLRSRTTSGVKQQMQPLTAEQEMLLTSDDQSLKDDQVANGSIAVLPDKESSIDCVSNCGTGINKDPLPPTKFNGDAFEGQLDNICDLETSLVENIDSTANVVDTIHKASDLANLQFSADSYNVSAPPGSNSSSHEIPAYEAVDLSYYATSFKDPSFGIPDSENRYDDNLEIANRAGLSSVSTDSTNQTICYQEGPLSPERTDNSKIPLGFCSGFEDQMPSEPLIIIPELGKSVDFDIRVAGETAASVLNEQDIEHGGMLHLPSNGSTLQPLANEINETVATGVIFGSDSDKNEQAQLTSETINFVEEHKLCESAPFISYSLSVSEDLSGIRPDTSSHRKIGRSLSFESLLPERTFSYAGIPAPSLVSADLKAHPGKVLVPAVVDQAQAQALIAMQVLKVIEADVHPGDLCTRREYARWLVSASSALSRNTVSKVYPAMYIENVTELAFEDVTPGDPDFPYIQGLAEAGIISSKLSTYDDGSMSGQQDSFCFSPESPLSRQDLVSWKMALEKRQLPEVDKKDLYQCSGYIDIDKIHPDAWPALVLDLSAGEQGITALAFGYTRLFQPNKPVTKAQAAIALATGDAAEVVGEELTRIEAESLAESAVNAHTALVAQVEKDLNASFEEELAMERKKIEVVEKLAEEARLELERLRAEREEENNALIRGRAAVESEMEVLSRLRREVEMQLQDLMSNKVEISFEKDRIQKLQKETESDNQVIVQLQYELEVERKALSMARTWAEEEAKRAREQARSLEEARSRWERHGIKVVVDGDLQEDASAGITWVTAAEEQATPIAETINRAESLVDKLKAMSAQVKVKSSNAIEKIIHKIETLITVLKQWASKGADHAKELRGTISAKVIRSMEEFQEAATGFSSNVGDKARKVAVDCKESADRFSQKFKTKI